MVFFLNSGREKTLLGESRLRKDLMDSVAVNDRNPIKKSFTQEFMEEILK